MNAHASAPLPVRRPARPHPSGPYWAEANDLRAPRLPLDLMPEVGPARLRSLGLAGAVRPGADGRVLALDVTARDGSVLSAELVMPGALLDRLAGRVCPHAAGACDHVRVLAAEAALDATLSELERAHSLAVLPRPGTARPRAFGWRLGLDLPGGAHELGLNFDADLLPALAATTAGWPRDPAARRDVAVAPRARLCRMALARSDAAAARPGDVLLPPRGRFSADRAVLVLGDRALMRLAVSGGSATVKGKPMSDDRTRSAPTAVEAVIDFALPCATLPAADLGALGKGSVLALETDDDALIVEIRLDGRPFGRGEVVSLGGRLGVEILELDDGG